MDIALSPKLKKTFRRSLRNSRGEVVETLVFEPQQPLKLNAKQLDAVRNDIGTALTVVKPYIKPKEHPSDPDREVCKPDWEATQGVALEEAIKKLEASEKAGVQPELTPFQMACLEKAADKPVPRKRKTKEQ